MATALCQRFPRQCQERLGAQLGTQGFGTTVFYIKNPGAHQKKLGTNVLNVLFPGRRPRHKTPNTLVLYIYRSIYLYIYISMCLFIALSIYLFIYISLYL